MHLLATMVYSMCTSYRQTLRSERQPATTEGKTARAAGKRSSGVWRSPETPEHHRFYYAPQC